MESGRRTSLSSESDENVDSEIKEDLNEEDWALFIGSKEREIERSRRMDYLIDAQMGGELSEMGYVERYVRSQVGKAKCVIKKVHSDLRDGSDKHYEPVLVSIGPYHHVRNTTLQDMEKHKVHYLQVLLEEVGKGEQSSDGYIEALKNENGELPALHCYVDNFQMAPDSFGQYLVLDGCFVLELFRRNLRPCRYKDSIYDTIFNTRWMKHRLERDLLLFENQIPLFVLLQLLPLTETRQGQDTFVELALRFFRFNGNQVYNLVDRNNIQLNHSQPDAPELYATQPDATQPYAIPHLLGLVYHALIPGQRPGHGGQRPGHGGPSPRHDVFDVEEDVIDVEEGSPPRPGVKDVEEDVIDVEEGSPPRPGVKDVEEGSCKAIRSAVALEEVGVKFSKGEYDHCVFFNISFGNGELRIPPLVIDDNTESFFRNLVAYEQYSKDNSLHRVVDYLQVMDCLINSPEDVELLRHCEIIDNRIGDDVKISYMFNHLCSGVYFDRSQFFYAQVFNDVNEFCNKRRNVWMAKLKNEYFGSPWSIISFVAAVVLLLFTAFQTGYSVASYYQPKIQG